MRQYFSLKTIKWLMVSLCFSVALAVLIDRAQAEEVEKIDPEKIITHDPSSKVVIDYSNWTLLLKATVTRARMSSRIYARKARAGIGTKVNYSNNNPTRLEASRVFYHYINEEELDYIHTLRLGMEALPQVIPFQTLNRNEQLAYWLNLYNITVYEQIAKRYPIRKLKELHQGSRKMDPLWDEKILNINGIAMSLNDIHYNIILKIWPDPIVLYGLYQGTIGGPNLRRRAFTGRSVYAQLEDNAEEFVNSLRGLRFRGKEAHVSVMYEWNRDLFPDFETDLRRHLRKYANFALITRLDSSRKVKAKVYDWHIADVLGGRRSRPGGAASTNPIAMVMAIGSDESAGLGGGFGGASSGIGGRFEGKVWNSAVLRNRLPNDAATFLKDFVARYRKLRGANVTIEEIDKTDLEKKTEPDKPEK